MLFLPLKLFSQTNVSTYVENKDTLPNNVSFDSSLILNIKKSAFEMFITIYSDSINNATSYGMLPLFLKNQNFDYHNSNFWFPPQSKISLRNIILLRACNCTTLKYIITDKSKIYKKKPDKTYAANLSNLSFYDLALKRYISLECDR